MTARARLSSALEAARDWHSALPQARVFCPWPDDLAWADLAPAEGPAAALLHSAPGDTETFAHPMLAALQAVAQDVEWRHTYTAAEVGQDFLDAFGWFELAGPSGHFTTHQTRITVGYWGPGLRYGRHHHRAEELYTIVSGQAEFLADGAPGTVLRPGDTRLHTSNQPHAMNTHATPVLALVLWRGDGLADPPRMTP
ncbi:MAG: dimethylsulfonioproprionate lyase family protein [Roseovarius sp.]